MKNVKIILISGNGGNTPKDNWLPYVTNELKNIGIKVINKQFPDSMLAREKYWLPFIKRIGADKNSILIGHSSGAIAAMRFAEKNKLYGSVLVAAYHTDLGVNDEKKSGYFNRPWNWHKINKNQKWIIQFASKNDPFIPIEEARYVHKKLNTEYYEYKYQGHFGTKKEPKRVFPELIDVIKLKISSN